MKQTFLSFFFVGLWSNSEIKSNYRLNKDSDVNIAILNLLDNIFSPTMVFEEL